jgi:hypothetical protein
MISLQRTYSPTAMDDNDGKGAAASTDPYYKRSTPSPVLSSLFNLLPSSSSSSFPLSSSQQQQQPMSVQRTKKSPSPRRIVTGAGISGGGSGVGIGGISSGRGRGVNQSPKNQSPSPKAMDTTGAIKRYAHMTRLHQSINQSIINHSIIGSSYMWVLHLLL